MAKPNQIEPSEFDRLPPYARVRVRTVASLYAVSPSTVLRRVREGLIPAPHKIGNTNVWSVGDLRNALTSDTKTAGVA